MRILILLLWCCALCASTKAVVFDFGGVMVKRNAQPLYDYIQETFEVDPLEDFKGDKLFWALMQEDGFWHEYAAGHQKMLPADWFEQLREREKLFVQTIPGMLELIEDLKSRGYMIALLTDTTRHRSDFYKSRGFYSPFELTVLSCDHDLRKPDPRLFEILLENLKLQAENCVFIDNRQINVAGARQLGIPAIHFQSFEQFAEELYAHIERSTVREK